MLLFSKKVAQKTPADEKSPKMLIRSLREMNSPDSDIISLRAGRIGLRQHFSPGVPSFAFSGGDFPNAGIHTPPSGVTGSFNKLVMF